MIPKWATLDRRFYLAKLLTDYLDQSGWQLDMLSGEVYHPSFTQKANQLIKDWISDDRQLAQADWKAERQRLHATAERRYPLAGQFNGISRDIFYADQSPYYLVGLGISGLTFKPFAKVRLSSSWFSLFVDIELGDSLKGLSKNQKRKAIRYGKVNDQIQARIGQAVKHYLNS